MNRKWSFGIVCALMAGVFVICNTVSISYAGEKVIKWRGQNAYPTPSLEGSPLKPNSAGAGNTGLELSKWMESVSNGRLKIDLAQPGAIVPVKDMFTSVSKGALDVAATLYAGYYTGTMPEADVEIGLPMAWENAEMWWDAMFNRGLYEEFQKIYEEHNIHWIPILSNEDYAIETTFPVSRLSDLQGKKYRALGMYGSLIEKLGGAPVVMSGSELYMGLKLGTVDGSIYGPTGVETSNFKEVWKYIIRVPNLNVVGLNMLINKDSWDSLPDDLKKTIDDNARYKAMGIATDNALYTTWVIDKAKREWGVKTVELPQEDIDKIREICVGLWDDVAKKSPRCAKLVNIVKDQLKMYGKLK